MKGFTYSLSRWHGVKSGTMVGGDVHTVTTTNRAADCFDIGGDSASGA